MRFVDAAIPAGFAWSSPFARWQGPLADVPGLELAAAVTRRALADRAVDASIADGLVLVGRCRSQTNFSARHSSPGASVRPASAAPMISQACATSVASLQSAAAAVDGTGGVQLVVVTDRTSNGPQLLFPTPQAKGGAPTLVHWVLDNFDRDPWAEAGMLFAGDSSAARMGVTKGELDELKIMRHEQYEDAVSNDVPRRYLVPVEIESAQQPVHLAADHGVRPLDPAKLRKMSPADPAGLHSYAAQTFPADGCAGAVVTTVERARELAGGEGVVRILATGHARVGKSRMPEAPVPAALRALDAAGLGIADVDAVTTHNPFAVNDLYFSAETGFPLERMNAFGCSLVFGHPQGPTGLRSIAELIEVLRLRGGGVGLFTGVRQAMSGPRWSCGWTTSR